MRDGIKQNYSSRLETLSKRFAISAKRIKTNHKSLPAKPIRVPKQAKPSLTTLR
jgi:hypothetical protein